MKLIVFYRLSSFLHSKKMFFLSGLITKIGYVLYNSYVPGGAAIGKNAKFAYGGIGVVIHDRAVIGSNVTIGQGITIGGKSGEKNVPVIGDNVYIGAGSRVLGDVYIGNDVIIAPNAVVISNVEAGSVVGGVPARVIKRKKAGG